MTETKSERWTRERSFHHSRFPPGRVAAERECSAAVVLPARECAASIGAVVGQLTPLIAAGAVDEILVVDAASVDGTARLAAAAGARVVQEDDLLAEFGPVMGKGDAMWRSLAATDAEVVCFLDADSHGPVAHYVSGLLGPLVCERDADFVKGHYRRPLALAQVRVEEGGGRVNHLTARPALALFYPELAGFRQPLAGEVAARRSLLEEIPFAAGYGVEVAMLIDVCRRVGLERMAQVDLDEHVNSHQPIAALSEMAQTVLATVAERLRREGRLAVEPSRIVERPAHAALARR
ncbi:MAG TPA: glucosyl-3-phosphoglycerate synthase [Solirubrobacteraceae bacterium]|nr:glucosyl-3-phosphoglycerate synthase [Solirubrobacteraceae bacterium]